MCSTLASQLNDKKANLKQMMQGVNGYIFKHFLKFSIVNCQKCVATHTDFRSFGSCCWRYSVSPIPANVLGFLFSQSDFGEDTNTEVVSGCQGFLFF